jgi:hypothetical protein
VLHAEPTALAARGVAGDEDIVDFAIEVGDVNGQVEVPVGGQGKSPLPLRVVG